MPLTINVGNIITTKKPHPCGCSEWDVLRTGADIKIKCRGCGHELMLPRSKIEKSIKKINCPGD